MAIFKTLIAYLTLPFNILGAVFGSIVFVIGSAFNSKKSNEEFLKTTNLQKDNKYVECLNNEKYFKYFWEIMMAFVDGTIRETAMSANLNGVSPNPRLHKLDDGSHCKLLDMAKAGRPLVINFGSCTWPPFMANLEKFRKLTEDFSKLADFVLVYIAEAHPTDGWAINGNIEVANHKSMEERIIATKKMLSMEPQHCPVLVDLLEDQCQKAFAAKPERLYIVQDGVIVYKGGQGPFEYKIEEVHDWLSRYQK